MKAGKGRGVGGMKCVRVSVMSGKALDLETPRGPARAHLDLVEGAAAAVVLGHGAGGGVEAADLLAASRAAAAAGLSVARVEQPYRVAGRRSPAPAGHLDEAWSAAVATLLDGPPPRLPLIPGRGVARAPVPGP